MKKIFFYSNIFKNDQSIGITKKVLGQIKTLRNLGYEVYYTSYGEDSLDIYDNEDNVCFSTKYKFKNKLKRVYRRWDLINASENFLKQSKIQFEFGYIRFHFFDKSYNNLLKTLKKQGAKVIVEAHSYPYIRKSLNAKLPIYLIDYLYTNEAKKSIDLVAGICDHKNIWGLPTINIDNGIDLSMITAKKQFKMKEEINILTVSNETEFHAYNKIVNGLSDYYSSGGSRIIKLHLVGKYMDSTKKLIKEKNLQDKVIFYGRLNGQKLDEVYENCEIGLGAFSFRKNETTGSCLKTKEYFAKGMPFINGWKEPAFDDDYQYVKRFNTKDVQINFFEVVNFYDSLKKYDSVVINDMREFAQKNYTWKAQFLKVFDYFEVSAHG